VTGLEHIPEAGGLVLAANHLSNFDPWALGVPLFPQRPLRFMSKIELFNPIVGPPLRAVGGFPVERGVNSSEAIRAATEMVRRGEVVAMFPEGTRRKKGVRKRVEPRPHSGAARIALTAGVPLVPAAIKGTDHLLRFARIRVAFGPAIELDDFRGLETAEAAQAATDRLMEAITRLEAAL
jgi:1-acyl-sn-glycerol-3-phosphate acyltransferase